MTEANQPAAPTQPAEPAVPQGYAVESTVVAPLPAQRAFPLKKADFLTLVDDNTGSERASRDLHIALCLTALVGMVGLIAAIDWSKPFTQQMIPSICFFVLLIVVAATGYGCIHHHLRMKHENTPYTRLKQFITKFFEEADQ